MRSFWGFVGLGVVCLGCSGKTTDTGSPGGGSGGGNATGAAGSVSSSGAGTQPVTSNVYVEEIAQTPVDKIDLLFMIDNSASMADKQEILKAAVPVLLARLVSPNCVDANGNPTSGSAQRDGTCASPGSTPEFKPVSDIHLGIVSSSLGAHGGNVCAAPSAGDDPTLSHLDDKAHLIGTVRTGLTSWNNSGFLAWDPAGTKNTPPGETNAASLLTNFAAMIAATGEHGCGYEASLESWYRFLIDPEPPQTVAKVGNQTTRQGTDADLLAQRAQFLRPDSLVAIVMLTDENDCSIRDDGVGWFVGATSHMPKASAACATNPNDPCCRSCAQNESSPPMGCSALSADPACSGAPAGSYNTWDNLHDSLNLRCYDQRQRFGFDLLYETQRYVDGLTRPVLPLQSDPSKMVANPLFDPGTSGKRPRDPSLVFLAGILGVPWQDVATPASLASPTALTYLSAVDLVAQGRWAQLLGEPSASPPLPPSDPFMVETPLERTGVNPNVPVDVASASSMNPKESAINGHEQHVPDLADLQYACTFELTTPRPCMPGDAACNCAATKDGDTSAVVAANSPLCQPPGGGPASTTQYFAKAYPGARELTVLKDFGSNAVVASICPKVVVAANPAQDPNYGYNPAMTALVDRLKEALGARCLPRAIEHTKDQSGADTPQIACAIVEAQRAGKCDCTLPGRSAADPGIVPAVLKELQQTGACGSAAGQPKCDDTGYCMCGLTQESGADLTACLANGVVSTPGFCYIDDAASPALASCPKNQKQLLRFVDSAEVKTPEPGALTFIACEGHPAGQ